MYMLKNFNNYILIQYHLEKSIKEQNINDNNQRNNSNNSNKSTKNIKN